MRSRNSRVNIDIDNTLLAKPFSVIFNPFSRANQAIFFSIPGSENDRSTRTPSLLEQNTKSTGEFKLSDVGISTGRLGNTKNKR
jgi:hypothetical protein